VREDICWSSNGLMVEECVVVNTWLTALPLLVGYGKGFFIREATWGALSQAGLAKGFLLFLVTSAAAAAAASSVMDM